MNAKNAPRGSSLDRVFGPLLRPFDPWFEKHRGSFLVKNLPNIITLIRLVLSPLLAYEIWRSLVNYSGGQQLFYCVIAVVVLFLSDGIDGTMAMRYEFNSSFGQVMDPIADKVLVWSVIVPLSLAASTLAASWLILAAAPLCLIAAIEVGVMAVTGVELKRRRSPRADSTGKWKLGTQGVLVTLFLAGLWAVAAGHIQAGTIILYGTFPVIVIAGILGLSSLRSHWNNLRARVAA